MSFSVRSRWVNGLTIENKWDEFQVISDQIPEKGGNGLGVCPVDILLASLASCRLMCAAGYAKKHGLAIQSMEAETFCDLEEMKQKGHLNFQCVMKVKGKLSEKERASLLSYVNQTCSVGHILHSANESSYSLEYTEAED